MALACFFSSSATCFSNEESRSFSCFLSSSSLAMISSALPFSMFSSIFSFCNLQVLISSSSSWQRLCSSCAASLEETSSCSWRCISSTSASHLLFTLLSDSLCDASSSRTLSSSSFSFLLVSFSLLSAELKAARLDASSSSDIFFSSSNRFLVASDLLSSCRQDMASAAALSTSSLHTIACASRALQWFEIPSAFAVLNMVSFDSYSRTIWSVRSLNNLLLVDFSLTALLSATSMPAVNDSWTTFCMWKSISFCMPVNLSSSSDFPHSVRNTDETALLAISLAFRRATWSNSPAGFEGVP
mmetsp:Transcript_26362/g.59918  ORF Transcript_26362/g.59918 Transcript_26362/m.59918 type:complete len:300 (-) Transcript_26362:59-958(-)